MMKWICKKKSNTSDHSGSRDKSSSRPRTMKPNVPKKDAADDEDKEGEAKVSKSKLQKKRSLGKTGEEEPKKGKRRRTFV